jgi:membrane associated rhomboid family serine protease
MAVPIDESLFRLISFVGLAFALLLSAAVLYRMSDRRLAPLRERFVLGVPWGTIIVICFLYLVYFLLQGGGKDGGPIVAGFRSWSLFYPQGVLFSSFAHSSEGHIASNVLGTVAFAPIVEYAWGHYPRENGRITHQSFQRPRGRIAAFVGAVFLVGIAGSVFVPGAVIGFSGVVFAFAGAAVVTRPATTVFAILGIRVLHLLRDSVRNPWVVAEARPRFISPSWADIALQGHLFGMLVGVLFGVALLRLTDEQPRLLFVWFAALVFAVTRSMYAIYWYLGADSFVLYRAIGAAGVFLMATLIAVAAKSRTRPLTDRVDIDISGRAVAVVLLIGVLCALGLVGVLYNVADVDAGEPASDGIAVNDYTVSYAENVEDQYIAGVTIPYQDTTSVSVSGVIVSSDSRNAWELTVSRQQLAFQGQALIPMGDARWRETVYVNRTAWAFVDGNSTYKVFARQVGEEQRHLLYAHDPAAGDLQVNGTNVSIRPAEDDYYTLEVRDNGSLVGTKRIPGRNENVTIANITFERENNDLYVRHEQTRFRLAEYRNRRKGS